MGTLLYFLLWAGFFFLVMRFGCGSHVMGHGHREREETHGGDVSRESSRAMWMPPETDIDPVARMSVRTEGAKSSVYQGRVYYFASDENRATFEADPERYVGGRSSSEAKSMEHHHG